MYTLLNVVSVCKFFIDSFYGFNSSGMLISLIDEPDFGLDSSKKLLSLEKKFTTDFLYKKCDLHFSYPSDKTQVIYIDKESKFLGHKKKLDCTQQRLFLPFYENKKFLKSTIFGSIKLLD